MTVELTKRPAAQPAFTDGNTNEDVYHFHGSYGTQEFRVPAGTLVTKQDQRWGSRESSDPRRTLPNMEVRDGALIIPVCDVIQEIIDRAEPVDMAKALWQNDDVKSEFMYCVTERYSEGGIDDGDRRELLQKLQSAVHSKALDKLACALCDVEYHTRNFWLQQRDRSDYARSYHDILSELELYHPAAHARIVERFGETAFRHDPDYDEFKIGGAHWNETRDHWRRYVESYFPYPEAFIKDPSDGLD